MDDLGKLSEKNEMTYSQVEPNLNVEPVKTACGFYSKDLQNTTWQNSEMLGVHYQCAFSRDFTGVINLQPIKVGQTLKIKGGFNLFRGKSTRGTWA